MPRASALKPTKNPDGSDGFRVDGVVQGSEAGRSVSGIGDIDGDGIKDMIIGAYRDGAQSLHFAGKSYVVYGQRTNSVKMRLEAAEVQSGLNFGLRPNPGEIRGQLFNDRDHDGLRDGNESVVAAVTVFLDLNENDRFDAGEPQTVTDAEGRYVFSGLDAFTSLAQPSRKYRVVELVSDDRLELQQSVPSKVQGNVGVTLFAADAKLRTGVDITGDGHGGFLLTGTDGVGTGFNAQEVFSVSADGRSVNGFAAADHPQGIVSDGTYAYWVDLYADSDSTRVFRQALAGGAKELVFDGGDRSLVTSATTRIVAATGLDFVAGSLVTVDALQGQLSRLPALANVAAGDVTAIGSARYAGFLDQAHAQFLDEENGVVYVADPGCVAVGDDHSRDLPARLLSIPLAGGSFTTLLAGDLPSFTFFGSAVPASRPQGIVVHDGTIYVSGDRAIYSLPISGGTPTVVAADERFAHLAGLTFVGDSLYVIDNGTPTSTNATVWQVTLQAQPPRTVHVDETSDTRSWDILLLPGQTVSDVDFARYDPNTVIGASGTQSIRGFVFRGCA